MIFPVRCFTCGALIGDKWSEFATRVSNGEDPGKVLDDMGITRYCCRRMFLSHVDVIDKVIKYGTIEEFVQPTPPARSRQP
ncbi:MAG: DNA-directed RNA polymerase subunit N [Thermofilum sp.]|jgi:DNA-directed RNA polymerase subunit N|uniref:DNA-directed RNA polymerase subunit Rpo10 n=1 Tax=Thermofilum adornatum TaxID=1365176 RepID=A0A7C1CEL4_9CREN|nr:DNA-directed RNA polymerase subunit N [Thermofilum sp.]MCI4408975.1 DNA-directed RNA polymerase subunit N [Thermofilum sp.]